MRAFARFFDASCLSCDRIEGMHLISLFFTSAFLLLAFVHYLANTFSLYWKYPWLDMPMHLLGGVTIGLAVALPYVSRLRILQRFSPLLITLCGVLILGVGWEVYELSMGTSSYKHGFWADTALDLLLDFIGALLGYWVAMRIKNI